MTKKKVLPPQLLLGALLIEISLWFFLPGMRIVLGGWRFLGLIPILVGLYLNLEAERALQKANTTVLPEENSRELVQDGVYSLSRNPMYLGMVMVLGGAAVMLGIPLGILIMGVFWFLIWYLYVRKEEQKMKTQFSADWNVYRSRVGRWISGL